MTEIFCSVDSPIFDRIIQSLAQPRPIPLGPVPDRSQLVQMVEAALWASVRREEGRELSFSLALAKADDCPDALKFGKPLPLTVANIVHLAPALLRKTSRLGVEPGPDGLVLWGMGTADQFPLSVEVRAVAPASLIVGVGYSNVAVFRGKEAEWIDLGLPNFVRLVSAGFASALDERHRILMTAVLVQVVAAMRHQAHGGTLLFVPGYRPVEWVYALRLRYFSPFFGLRAILDRILRDAPDTLTGWEALPRIPDLHHFLVGEAHKVSASMIRMTRMVGSLTAVDGATVLDEYLSVVGFGATINIDEVATGALTVLTTTVGRLAREEPPIEEDVTQLGGTRHQSAARFVAKHHDSVAVVASHDGPLTVMFWATDREQVAAIRDVDVLFD